MDINDTGLQLASMLQMGHKMNPNVAKLLRVKLSSAEATSQGLEPVFPEGHDFHERIFYDPKEGSYYDANSDVYISLEEAARFGIPM